MSNPISALGTVGEGARSGRWTARLVWYLRAMAGLSFIKGLYHWSAVIGIGDATGFAFESSSLAWKTATNFFAVIDLVAAVGLWLAAPWGAVVWLTSVISMAAVEILFPQIYGGHLWVVAVELLLLGAYLGLALMAAREQPP
jgi:uncharacterized membrane protein (DUF2068 family)